MQGTDRYVILAHLLLAAIVWTTLSKLLGGLAYVANLPDPALLGSVTVIGLIALLGAAGGVYYLYQHKAARAFFADVVIEMRKVTWPSSKETQTATVVVIITSVILALMMGLFDFMWGHITGFIYTT